MDDISKKSILIKGPGRCGTHLLLNWFYLHTDHVEFDHANFPGFDPGSDDRPIVNQQVYAAVDEQAPKKPIIFECHHLDQSRYIPANPNDWVLIHLSRKNMFDQIMSFAVAIHLGKWTYSPPYDGTEVPSKFNVSLPWLLSKREEIITREKLISDIDTSQFYRAYKFNYEDLLKNKHNKSLSCFKTKDGVEQLDMTIKSPYSYKDLVENWEFLKDWWSRHL